MVDVEELMSSSVELLRSREYGGGGASGVAVAVGAVVANSRRLRIVRTHQDRRSIAILSLRELSRKGARWIYTYTWALNTSFMDAMRYVVCWVLSYTKVLPWFY